MSKICGVGISARTASFVIVEGSKESYQIIEGNLKKLDLNDDKLQSQLQVFSKSMEEMLTLNKIDKVCIKRPSTSGRFQAKHTAFKIEAIIQLLETEVELIAPQTISAHLKKDVRLLPMMDKVLKYQGAALEAAYYGLEES